jgi:signal transduction histidine kinase
MCARRMVEGGSVQIVATSRGDISPIPLRITDTLYRIGQEAIANAVRHAHPTKLTISLEYTRNLVHLLVSDNGIGFTQSGESGGFGIRGMRKRAASVSARLQILSNPGGRTDVRVAVPLPARITILSWPQFLWKYLRELRPHVESSRQPNPNSYRG